MNKRVIFTFFSLLAGLTFGQEKGSYKLEMNSDLGYETNILKAPSTFADSLGNFSSRDNLWQNATFLGFGSRYISTSANGKHQFILNGLWNRAFFLNEGTEAGELSAGTAYRLKFKRFSNKWSFAYRNFIRSGEDLDNLIGAPLTYKRLTLRSDFSWKLGKRTQLELRPFFIQKYYQRAGYEQFKYDDFGGDISWKYRYRIKNKVGHGFSVRFHQRNYQILKEVEPMEFDEEFEDEFDVEMDDEIGSSRTWRYYGLNYSTRIPIGDHIRIEGRVGYTHRSDLIQERLGYNQYVGGIAFKFKRDKFRMDLSTLYTNRFYTDFESQNSLLNYQYIQYEGRVRYDFTDRFALQFSHAGKKRLSNAERDNSRTLRSYFITQFKVSGVWTLKGDYSWGRKRSK